ncbi:hypothetical protein Clocel_0848 [Clostridium cellulovorans 743B]|uniref:Uncharacterized protein n=1 Tax=Clostridium cellulovorans (strain ATCC 35296 / DSM 3052 / OCM 3 / 743B) TaxID=573061 RepID=D9SSM1_CLOC7|nr:hypothetical protein Clocel_0848 [Clostridium cellulovorans 743B]
MISKEFLALFDNMKEKSGKIMRANEYRKSVRKYTQDGEKHIKNFTKY